MKEYYYEEGKMCVREVKGPDIPPILENGQLSVVFSDGTEEPPELSDSAWSINFDDDKGGNE